MNPGVARLEATPVAGRMPALRPKFIGLPIADFGINRKSQIKTRK
jgi:hypothetical protein